MEACTIAFNVTGDVRNVAAIERVLISNRDKYTKGKGGWLRIPS